MENKRFENYVNRAFEELPDEFREKMDNIAISVMDYPTREQLQSVGLKEGSLLLGLFSGTPFGAVPSFYSGPVMPSEIFLFKKNIEAITSSELQVIDQIRLTLLHEIGHYFGMTEEELRRYT